VVIGGGIGSIERDEAFKEIQQVMRIR
jgi:hypothetical protein